MNVRIFIALSTVAALSIPAIAQRRRDGAAPAPPPVVSRTVLAKRGEKVQVPLGIHGVRGGKLEFIIRTPPTYGRLSAVSATSLNSATVTYSSSGKRAVAEDRFAYAVRSSEGVSAAGLITIRFVEAPPQPPKLKFPGPQEFPAVFPGQVSTVELDIVNEGGGAAEGELAVPEPWEIEGIKIFRLSGGQRATFKILFKSDKPGTSTGNLTITGTERKLIPLTATVQERFAVIPPVLKLSPQPGTQTRTGTIRISNYSHEDASVVVGTSARLITDRIVKVPARGSTAFPIFAEAVDSGAFEERLSLSSEGWETSLTVQAGAVGMILKFVGDEVRIAGGTGASAIATLENSGGDDVTVRLDIDPPFELTRNVVTVPARGRIDVPVRVPRAGPGSYRATLRTAAAGVPALVEVTAELAQQAGVSPTAVENPRQEPAAEPDAANAGTTPDDDLPWMPSTLGEIPNAIGSVARKIGIDSVVLDWPASLTATSDVRLEQRVLSLSGDGGLQINWETFPRVRIAAAGERMTAEIRDLNPASLYMIRAVSGAGPEATTWFTTEFWTPPKTPLFNFGWRMPSLVLALAALAFSLWRSRREKKR